MSVIYKDGNSNIRLDIRTQTKLCSKFDRLMQLKKNFLLLHSSEF